VGKVHFSEIISSVELYQLNTRYNFTEVYFSHSQHNPSPILKQYSSTLDIISLRCTFCVELYRFNIGGELCCEWEKYTSVKLYLVLSYTVLI
jgi:hypothetical protein